ncbi:MAG TPA: hypothetical protein PK239_00625 [Chitinophagales bacterium]|nr:hypothetical protein [Chitinophagales bacterium]
MRTSNLSKRRLKRIISCFAAGLTAIDTSYKLKLHRNTVNKYYRQIRESIAQHQLALKAQMPLLNKTEQYYKLLWHKNKGLCLQPENVATSELMCFVVVAEGEHVFVFPENDDVNRSLPINEEDDSVVSRFFHYAKDKLTRFYGVKPEYTYLYLQELEFRFNTHESNLSNLLLKLLEPEKGSKKTGGLTQEGFDA